MEVLQKELQLIQKKLINNNESDLINNQFGNCCHLKLLIRAWGSYNEEGYMLIR